jgi:solute carrier family 35 protein F5
VVFWIMGWKYKAGLGLISTVVIIWVTSAEVTQVRLRFIYSPCFFLFLCLILVICFLFGCQEEVGKRTDS